MKRWIPQTAFQKQLDDKLREALSLQTKSKQRFHLFEEIKKMISPYITYIDMADRDIDGHFATYINNFIDEYSKNTTVYGVDYYKDYMKTDSPKELCNELIMRRIYRSVNDRKSLFINLDKQQKEQWPHIQNWMPESEFQIKLDNEFRKAFELKGEKRQNAFITLYAHSAVITTLENEPPDTILFAWYLKSMAQIESGLPNSGVRSVDTILHNIYYEVNNDLSYNIENEKTGKNYQLHDTSVINKKYIQENIKLITSIINEKDSTSSREDNILSLLEDAKTHNRATYMWLLTKLHAVIEKKQYNEVIFLLHDLGYKSYIPDHPHFDELEFLSRLKSKIGLEIALEYNYAEKNSKRDRDKSRTERDNMFFSSIYPSKNTIPPVANKIEDIINSISVSQVDFSIEPQNNFLGNKIEYLSLPNSNNNVSIANINALWALHQIIMAMNKNNDNKVESITEFAEQYLKSCGPHLNNKVELEHVYKEALYKTNDREKFLKDTHYKCHHPS